MRRVTRFIVLAAALTLTAADTGAEVPIDDARRLVADREFQSAIDLLENYAEQHEDDARAWLELGRVYLAAGHWDDAIRTQEKAAEMRPNDVEFRLALSAAYREKARRSGGFTAMRTARKWKKELERCYEMWPDNIEVRRWLVGYLLNAPGSNR
jgi:tetratricopeptide (TPR) repeat protein